MKNELTMAITGNVEVNREWMKGTDERKKRMFTARSGYKRRVRRGLKRAGKYSDLHLLLVDEDELSVRFLLTALRRLGMRGEVADSGQTALRMLEDAAAAGRPYDICLLNWDMGSEKGAGLVKKIRKRFLPQQMLIACFYRENSGSFRIAAQSGCDYRQKRPLGQREMYELLAVMNHDLAVLREKTK